MPAGFDIKIASVSCNQTGGDWPRNLANICKGIDKAAADGADIVCFEELGLSGYERGDDFQYSDNAKTRELLQIIADYAASKDPNLIVSVGHPWYFADKDLPDQPERRKTPIFNRINKQFNVATLMLGGTVIAMTAKDYLFTYERGYEGRHFEEWSGRLADGYKNAFGKGRDGAIFIELPGMAYLNGKEVAPRVIPFGSPVIQVRDRKSKSRVINIYQQICEAYWVGSRFDGSGDNKDFSRDNPLARKSRDFDITVCINPNASPPVKNKIDKHYELCRLGSEYCGVLVHTDGLGSNGSTFSQFGSRLVAQNGKVISQGRRAIFADVGYTSKTVTVKVPSDKGRAPHAIVERVFRDKHSADAQDGPAKWENGPRRELEEEMRIELLWLFDYMRKNRISGIAQALSGGKDSAYNAAKVRMMVELAIGELGVEGFLSSMNHLPYKDKVLAASKSGKEAAVDATMEHMLTCVYMGTDNSSEETLRAAKTLVEGGKTADGVKFKGIGGKFAYRNVQRLVEVYAEIFSGVNPSEISDERDAEIRNEIAAILRLRGDETTPQELQRRIQVLKSTFEEVTGDVLSTANPDHSLPYENIQARLRQVLIMLFSNVENKIAISNPNLDEGRNSYATWGGDLHGGMISGNAHKGKHRQTEHMQMLYDHGLEGMAPVKAFHWALQNRPSAELQPKSKDGKVTQFDEDQLGRTFEQMDIISGFMLNDRPLHQGERKNSPIEVFEKCRDNKAFKGDSIELLHDRLRMSYDKWAHAQFKIHGSPIAFTYGENVDHQSSLRTPNISSFHRPELAQLAVYCLSLVAKREKTTLDKLTGFSLDDLLTRALIDEDFGKALSSKMWTPGATDGRKMKLTTLYAFIKKEGFEKLAKPTTATEILEAAAEYRETADEVGSKETRRKRKKN